MPPIIVQYLREGEMRNLYQLFERIKNDLYCPVCGEKFSSTQIKLKGLFDKTLIIQTICDNNHLTVFITTCYEKNNSEVITDNDIIDLHEELKNFNGDFTTTWNKSS